MDGHGIHIDIQTIEEENRLGIKLLTFLTHTTHKLQPLDVSVFGIFKSYFTYERASWLEKNLGIEVKMFELAKIGM